jgi:hypothetical protein
MKYGQVFVRGKNNTDEWDSIDVLRLDDESFRAFVIDMLFRAGIVCGIKSEVLKDRKDIIYKERRVKKGVTKI